MDTSAAIRQYFLNSRDKPGNRYVKYLGAARPPKNASNAPARPQTGVTLTATGGRQRRLELPYMFQFQKKSRFVDSSAVRQ